MGRTYLANDDPSTRTPGTRKEEYVNADKRDHGANSLRVLSIGDTNDRDNELANDHPKGTPEKEGTTADFFDCPEGDGCGKHVHDGGDHADQEGVIDCSKSCEEGCAEVEDEVDTGPSAREYIS